MGSRPVVQPPPPGFVLEEPPPPPGFVLEDSITAQAQPEPESATRRFASGVWQNVNPVNIAKGIYGMARHPIDTGTAQWNAMSGEWEKAGQAGMEGRYSEMVGHATAGSIPFVGPAAAAIGEKIGSGEDMAGGLGQGVGLISSMFMPRVAGAVAKKGLAVTKGLAPFASSVDPAVVAAAAREGIEMPASAVSTSKVVPVLEAMSAKGLGGGQTVSRISGAVSELTAKADHLAARASRLATESQRGIAIAEGLESFRNAWIRAKNALYKDAKIPETLTADTGRSVQLLDDILAQKQGAARVAGRATDLSFFENLRQGLSSGKVKAADLRAAIQDLNGKIGGAYADAWSAANKQLLKKVAATLSEDFEASLKAGAPDVATKLEAANATYRYGLAKINSAFGKTISKLAKAGEYDKIGQAIANSSMSVDNIPAILEVVGPEGSAAIAASVLAEIVARSKNANGMLTPQGLARGVARWEKASPGALDALLTPDQAARLADLAKLSSAMEKGAKLAEGSQTAFLARSMGEVGLAFTNPLLALKVVLGDFAANRFLASKYGQRWMTQGYKPWSVSVPGLSGPAKVKLEATTRIGSAAASASNAMQPAPATR